MNIDKNKLRKSLESYNIRKSDFEYIIEECEIKRDCSKCTLKNNFGSCQNCSANKSDLYQEEQNELDNLLKELDVIMEKIKCYHKKS